MYENNDDEELKEYREPIWKSIDFESCIVCDGELEAESKIIDDNYFYDEDPVRCIGKCNKIMGNISADGEECHVSYNEEH